MHFGENQLSRGLISLSLLPSAHRRTFQRSPVRSSTWFYPCFNLAKGRSPPLRVRHPRLVALLGLAFASAALRKSLALPRTPTRRLIKQKARHCPIRGSDTLQTYGFRFCFTPLAAVLFTFPSRYLFAIGRRLVFSLARWSARFRTSFHV